ncbi:unnamed protein product [Didymodactylos carnosus]|uniref:Inositol polyphosphate-related phosphatase domain-containing protein n=1 Tax=Didymodactylos carnosus TaxID=1234261 RepID=A0A815ABV0_9BILA|nr:unnamed protein product [Didymodactylos carnosus]CAF4027433.1 unnamed protein product [Didymodactylos carnosus]
MKQGTISNGCFQEYFEPKITFAPTYKYEVGSTDRFILTKQGSNRPSYCDRIFSYISTDQPPLKVQSYQALHDVTYSDHHPVRLDFTLFDNKTSKSRS